MTLDCGGPYCILEDGKYASILFTRLRLRFALIGKNCDVDTTKF